MVIMKEKRERHYHTLTELAQAADLCAKTFIRRVKELLTDPEISEKFGTYRKGALTLYQQRILIQHLPELFHLRDEDEDF